MNTMSILIHSHIDALQCSLDTATNENQKHTLRQMIRYHQLDAAWNKAWHDKDKIKAMRINRIQDSIISNLASKL